MGRDTRVVLTAMALMAFGLLGLALNAGLSEAAVTLAF